MTRSERLARRMCIASLLLLKDKGQGNESKRVYVAPMPEEAEEADEEVLHSVECKQKRQRQRNASGKHMNRAATRSKWPEPRRGDIIWRRRACERLRLIFRDGDDEL